MKIKSIEITDIKGTKHYQFKPGTLTVIQGSNGTGKSSIIDAFRIIFEGGHDPNWLRKGAKKGTITLVIQDEKTGKALATVTKTVTEKSSKLEAFSSDGEVIPGPQTFVNQFVDALAINPARLLLAKPKELVAELLEIMPLTFTAEEINKAAGHRLGNLTPTQSTYTLDGLEMFRQQVYDTRKTHNKAARDAEGTVTELRKALPDDDGTQSKDWASAIAEMESLVTAMNTTEASDIADIVEQAKQVRQKTVDDFSAKEAEIRDRFQKELQDLEVQKRETLTAINSEEAQAVAKVKESRAADRQIVATELATARERLAQKQKAIGTSELIEKFDKEMSANNLRADELTTALELLDALKKQKLDALPIPGLEVRSNLVFVDGIAWEHINTAKKVEIAFQISALRESRLPFIVIDDAEHFDTALWEAFKQGALESGFQVIAARVSDGPLNIETVEPVAVG